MADPEIYPEPQPLSPSETAGKILSSARKGWDLTIEEVAEDLNLSTDTIRALEQDDYDKLPGYTFVKGYIRSYANVLRLNPDDVIAKVNLQPEKLSEIPTAPGAIRLKAKRPAKKKKKRTFVLKFFLILIVTAALGVFGMSQLSKIDTAELAEIFKLPAKNTKETESDEIIFPTQEDTEESSDQPKSALIRIE